MSGRRPQRRGGRRPSKPITTGLWQAVPAPDAPEPIQPARDATALIGSLGAPPLRGGPSAEHYLAAVVERAAGLAVALAASADLLSTPGEAAPEA
jgi:hypothetical protein